MQENIIDRIAREALTKHNKKRLFGMCDCEYTDFEDVQTELGEVTARIEEDKIQGIIFRQDDSENNSISLKDIGFCDYLISVIGYEIITDVHCEVRVEGCNYIKVSGLSIIRIDNANSGHVIIRAPKDTPYMVICGACSIDFVNGAARFDLDAVSIYSRYLVINSKYYKVCRTEADIRAALNECGITMKDDDIKRLCNVELVRSMYK